MPTLSSPTRGADRNLEMMTVSSLRCLLYTSDAADDLLCVDLGGRRIIQKKKKLYRRIRQLFYKQQPPEAI